MRSTIIYDIKRSLLKPLVLLMLILFAALGVATTYYTYTSLASLYPNVEGVVIYIKVENIKVDEGSKTVSRCILMGGIFDRRGDPIEGSLTLIANGSRIYSFKSTSTFIIENLSICGHDIDAIEISTNLVKRNISGVQILSETTVHNATFLTTSSILAYGGYDQKLYVGPTLVVFKTFINDLKSLKARIYTFTVNTSLMSIELTKPMVLNYTFSRLSTDIHTDTKINQSQGSITIRNHIEKFDLPLDKDKDVIQFYSEEASGQSIANINYMLSVFDEIYYVELITGPAGLNTILALFPIAVIYISHTLFAKPRSTGALEFVLARPMTRFDLYLSRYLAGAIIIAISSAIFLVVCVILQPLVLRFGLDPWSYILLYLGILASLLTFHTLCYAIASTTRSGSYLAISIALYILFAMLWSLVTIAIAFMLGISIMSTSYQELSYKLSYLNPLQFINIARYYILLSYEAINEISVLNPVLAIVVPLLWNIGLFSLGFWRFRKINLSS